MVKIKELQLAQEHAMPSPPAEFLPELPGKADFKAALARVEAWFADEPLHRPPVRFSEHNAEYSGGPLAAGRRWPDLKSRWFDAEFQVDYFIESIRGRVFYGETFPVFWPNLGPNVYAAFHGGSWNTARSPPGSAIAFTTGAMPTG